MAAADALAPTRAACFDAAEAAVASRTASAACTAGLLAHARMHVNGAPVAPPDAISHATGGGGGGGGASPHPSASAHARLPRPSDARPPSSALHDE